MHDEPSPAPTQLLRLVASEASAINEASAHVDSAVAAHASATVAAGAVYVQPPEPSHVASFSLTVPAMVTELQPLDASSSYWPASQLAHVVASAGAYVPSVHSTHSVAGLLSASAYPATQSVQTVCAAAASSLAQT